ncbi:MAG: FUSC family protein [Steroidobacteraceae bacterium]
MSRLQALQVSGAELLFSLKTFAAALLAFYIALSVGLPRPFWSLMAAYIVANPLAGAVRSKGLFRLAGTVIGCLATLLMVPLLSNAPVLLVLALSAWVGLCLYVSLLDRTPRAYAFMLAGYTAALIGFPSVDAPGVLFDTASARVEEILLGIVCATLVHSIVLPQSLAPSLLGLLDRALADSRQWFADLLGSVPQRAGADPAAQERVALAQDRRRLAADITQLRLLSTHVPFDTTHLRLTVTSLHGMQNRIAALTPLFSAVEDRLHALRDAQGRLPADVTQLLQVVEQWLLAAADESGAVWVRQALRLFVQQASGRPAWEGALRIALVARLAQLVDGWLACRALRSDVDAGLQGRVVAERDDIEPAQPLHRDHGMAALSALAAFLATALSCALWVLSSWPMGSVAAMMAAVFCCFFATMDDPVPAIHVFLKYTLWSLPVAALYVLVLMPLVQDMLSLAVVCAPLLLVLGILMARPRLAMPAMALLFGVIGALAARDTSSADFVSFLNSMIAQVVGVLVAARVTRLVRSVGSEWMVRRLRRATWRELGEMAGVEHVPERSYGYVARTLDRLGLLAARIAPRAEVPDAAADAVIDETLRNLRSGADLNTLQRLHAQLPPAARDAVRALLAACAAQLRSGASGPGALPAALRADIDAALAVTLAALRTATPAPAQQQACLVIAALVGLRRNFFRDAPAPQPVLVEGT